ncbi:MAG TPA: AmmeMemoRadiSam system protein B [Geobacteraceae bacterium]|nr:AmmeMemoRadiSam system protein B [Geobacteraceae bacterium]
MIRHPAVSGQFYSGNPTTLRNELDRFIKTGLEREKVIGIIAPHAGYMYSGAVAGSVYSIIEIPDTVIILGPNHHGYGAKMALYPAGEWITPLRTTKVNEKLSQLIKGNSSRIEEDSGAHRYEHSLEVQLPFLQNINPDLSVVPICLGSCSFEECMELGTGIAKAIREFEKDVLMVASSDMTHYESASAAKKKDQLALNEVLALNPEGLLKTCRNEAISMCGVIPATVMLVAALELGARKATLVNYATSGDVTGDNEQVVAYAALTIR